MNSKRKGFSLVELIIVVVLGTLVLAAAMQVLLTNQRTYTAQSAQIQSQQSTRAAMDVLRGELREISAQGGDLVTMGTYSLRVRTMRKFGVVCSINRSTPSLTVIKVGDWFAVRDSVFIFADNNTSISADDNWFQAYVTGVDTTSVTCASSTAHKLTFGSQASLFQAAGDSVQTGAPIRSFIYYSYGLVTMDGETYLGRTDASGTSVPLVGPLKASTGVQFAYLNGSGAVTAVATAVRRIQVTIRTSSGAVNSVGQQVSDSITGVIYTRN